MKSFTIELQRIKAMSNSHGLIRARVDAMVQAAPGVTMAASRAAH